MPTAGGTSPNRLHWALATVPGIAFSAALLYFLRDILQPPYSDADYRGSLVDTWQLYALVSVAVGGGVGLLAAATGIGAWRSRAGVRRLFGVVTVLGLFTLMAVLVATHLVTRAAEHATGSSLTIIW